MKYLVAFAVLLGVANAGLVKRATGDQSPKVWDALVQLRGKNGLSVEQIQDLFLNAVPGQDFPIISEIPQNNIDCGSFKQPGFYADIDAGRCQIFHRCDVHGNLTSYLCPNMTLFNQITLVCDWWYNVDCSKAKQFYDYSNSRLYQEGVPLLDNQDEIQEATGAVPSAKPSGAKSGNSGTKRSGGAKKKSKAH